MKRMVRVRLAALIMALALMLPGLSIATGAAAPASPAALSDNHRGANGSYTGPVTLNAPAGYEIATAADGAFGATAEHTPAGDGLGFAAYYLRQTGTETVFGPYYLPYRFDATAPGVTGAMLSAPDGAAEIVLCFSEPAAAVAGGTVRVQANGAAYAATLEAGPVAPRYAIAAQRFTDEAGGALPLDPGLAYTVAADAGAFADAAGNLCAQSAALAIPAAEAGSVRILHNLSPNMGWTLVAAESAADSGASVPSGTLIRAVAATDIVNPCTFAVFSGGQPVSGADLATGYAVSGNTEVYALPGALAGAAVITGTAEYGQTLTAAFTPSGAGAPSGLAYAWKRGDMTVSAGTGVATYALTKDDIGQTVSVTVTSPWCTGEAAAAGVGVSKAAVAAPGAPTFETQSDASARLAEVAGCEYRVNGGAWQDSTEFSLEKGQSYAFEQRYKETETAKASPASPALTLNTPAALTGTVAIKGEARVKATVSAEVSDDTNNTGELSYEWKRDAVKISDAQAYIIQPEDVNKALTVEVSSSVQEGSLAAVTPVVQKAIVSAPPAPTLAGSTASSITLNAVAGCEYSLGGTSWQNAAAFSNLTAGTTYTFYQRYKETDTAQASPMSAPAGFATTSTLSGVIRVDGDVRFGKTLIATFSGSANSGSLTYIWYRGSVNVGSGQYYDVSAADIGNPIYVRVVGSAASGSVTQLVGVVQKAEYVGNAPDAPTRASRSTSKISLNPTDGMEYSRDGANWQSSAVFTGLKAGTAYKFYQRYKATATIAASPASPALTTSTSSSGSSSGSGSENRDDDGDTTVTPSGTALTSYTLSGENTRILFSTMESLIAGNKAQDVTIRSSGVEYTFQKGTMQLTPGALWYDFGAKINGCAHQQAAEQAADGHFVALVHFNMDGSLPAKAGIRILLGTAQAGKTLYYYKFTPNTGALTFMQTALVDASGWAAVEQSSCSDYVFLDADIFAAALVTPAPTPAMTPQASPSPSALIAEKPEASGGLGGWLILLIMIVALLLIVVGVVMFIKSRGERSDPFDDDLFIDGGYDDEFDGNDYADGLNDGYDEAPDDGDSDDEYRDFGNDRDYDAPEDRGAPRRRR